MCLSHLYRRFCAELGKMGVVLQCKADWGLDEQLIIIFIFCKKRVILSAFLTVKIYKHEVHLPSLPASHIAQSKLKWIALNQEPAPSVLYLEHLVNGIFITVGGVVKQEKTKTFTPHQSKKIHRNTK